MRVILVLLLIALTPYNVVASPISHPHIRAKSQTDITTQDQRGTQQSPLIIKGDVTTNTAEKSIEERKQEEEKIEIERSVANYTGLLAFFTLVLVSVTGVLACFTYKLWRETQRTLTVTQRAYIKISHVPPGLEFNAGVPAYSVQIKVENLGQTPARITYAKVWRWTLNATESLPAVPRYTPHGEKEELFLYRNDSFFFIERFQVTDKDFRDIQSEKKILCVYGYVDYLDRFGKRHRAGYARRYNPKGTPKRDNLPLVTQPGYNYDRERNRSEGNDWDE